MTRCEALCFVICLSADHPTRHRGVRCRCDHAGPEVLAIPFHEFSAIWINEIREAVGQAELRRPDPALGRGSEEPWLRPIRSPHKLRDVCERMIFRHALVEIGDELVELLG